MPRLIRYFGFGLIAISLTYLAGCKSGRVIDPTYPVTGTVTMDGKPLAKGLISFEAEDDLAKGLSPAGGEIIDGKYTLQARVGNKTVRISALQETGEADETGAKATVETIPEKYNTNTELTAEVSADDANQFDFELKKE